MNLNLVVWWVCCKFAAGITRKLTNKMEKLNGSYNTQSTNQLLSAPTKRIEYIDAMRGFTMILVVLAHIAIYCMDLEGVPKYHSYLRIFRMPLFFFISGFVLYKDGVVWNLQHIGKFLKKKFSVQIISTAIFFTIAVYISKGSFIGCITESTKGGYWFTYTFFIYFLFYSILRFVFRKKEDYAILVVAAFFYVINWPPLYEAIPLSDCVKNTLCIELWYYFCFFLIGTLVKKHFGVVQQMLDKDVFLMVCVLLFFLLNIFSALVPGNGIIGVVASFCTRMSGILLVFSFFRKNQSWFTQEKRIGRSLQYIGRRTLDIYLLHYFFLPKHMSQIVTIFRDFPMPAIEFVYSLVVALIVIAFCLIISNVIRLSPTLAYLLFGARKEK